MKTNPSHALFTTVVIFSVYLTANAQQAARPMTHLSTVTACDMSAASRTELLCSKFEYEHRSPTIFNKGTGGRPLKTTGNILAAIGGGMMGWYLGTKLGDEDSDISSGILIGGAALTLTGIVLSTIGSKQINRSLSNNRKYQPSFAFQKDYRGNTAFCIRMTSILK